MVGRHESKHARRYFILGSKSEGTYKAQAHSDGISSGARICGLDLGGVDLADDIPGSAVSEAEGEDSDDDDPARGAVGLYGARSVEAADQ